MSGSLLSRDLRSILRVLPRLYAPVRPETFPQVAMAVIEQLMPAPWISYDEVDRDRGVVVNQLSREPPLPYEEWVQRWEQHVAQHPCISYAKAGGDKAVVTISDFLTSREFRQTGLYKDCFMPGGMTHQLACNLPAAGRVVGMGITRDAEFTPRERAIVEVLRPHMAQARVNSFFFGPSDASVSPDDLIVQLDENGRVNAWPHRIQLMLVNFFDCQFRGRWTAPPTLLGWIAEHFNRLKAGEAASSTFQPLVVQRESSRLTVRFFYTHDGLPFLGFEETRDSADPFRFTAIGLTPRQSEILTWVAAGKRDSEIGQILDSSSRTISNHIHRILKKLRVETRTGAVTEAEFRLRRQD